MKKKLILGISLAAIFSLTACELTLDPVGDLNSSSSKTSETNSSSSSESKSSSSSEGEEGDELSIKSSANFKTYFGLTEDSILTSTYYLTNKYSDVYYVKFKDAYTYLYQLALYNGRSDLTLTKSEKGNHIFEYSNEKGKFVIDTENELFSIPDPSQNFSILGYYNNASYIADGYDTDFVRFSDDTKELKHEEDIVFDLSKYDIDLFDLNGEVYIPLITFVDIFWTGNGNSLSFNGKDLYYTGALNGDRYPESVDPGTLDYKYYNESPWKQKSKRSAALATFTYNEMCFALDHFYGLTDFRGITSFDKYFSNNGYKNDLLSTNSETYEKALVRFTARWLYEGHSGYTKVSPFNFKSNFRDYYNENLVYNEKNNKIWPRHDQLKELRENSGKTVGVSFSGKTAIITFDSFVKAGNTYGYDVEDYTYGELAGFDNYLFFKKAFLDISNHGNIENVVIDVTYNGGGMVDSLPWLYAFMSDDPTITMKHTVTKEISEVHYEVDLNQNGIYGDSGDTYQGQYNFFIMTSNFSFSCGNAFPTFAKKFGYATIIGEESGGGACCVGAYSTACGTIFRFSSPYQFGTYTNNTWTANENGITPDYLFPYTDFYDDVKIDTFVQSIA